MSQFKRLLDEENLSKAFQQLDITPSEREQLSNIPSVEEENKRRIELDSKRRRIIEKLKSSKTIELKYKRIIYTFKKVYPYIVEDIKELTKNLLIFKDSVVLVKSSVDGKILWDECYELPQGFINTCGTRDFHNLSSKDSVVSIIESKHNQ